MKISPCPFCGSEASIITDKETFERVKEKNGGACVQIRCDEFLGCGAEMFTHTLESSGDSYESVLEEAINRWNRRTFNA